MKPTNDFTFLSFHSQLQITTEQPDEIRRMEKGTFEIVHIGGMTIGRATYQPGWR